MKKSNSGIRKNKYQVHLSKISNKVEDNENYGACKRKSIFKEVGRRVKSCVEEEIGEISRSGTTLGTSHIDGRIDGGGEEEK